MRKICVVTGTRAEFGLLKPVMEAITAKKGLELKLIVTGMHLSKDFGETKNEIISAGFTPDAEVELLASDDKGVSAAAALGDGVKGLANALETIKPDIVLVLGDRSETFAAVMAATMMNIPVAHIHGGDVSEGGIDEAVRHAITKIANIHFPATEKSAERIKKMGEEEWRIFVTGAPGLDTIRKKKLQSREGICKKLGLDAGNPYVLLVQHSVSTHLEKGGAEIRESLEALKDFGRQAVVIYPNSDSGGREMIKVIEEYSGPRIKAFKSLPHEDYLSLLKHAYALVGNSSSGMIEAPEFGVPVINIGQRQKGRERGENVIDVAPEREEIITALKACKGEKSASKGPYDGGNTGEKIAEILSTITIDKRLLQKRLDY